MTPEEIPQELVDLLDERAGKKHSRDGQVLTTLAEILTKYDELRRSGKETNRKCPKCNTYELTWTQVESRNYQLWVCWHCHYEETDLD